MRKSLCRDVLSTVILTCLLVCVPLNGFLVFRGMQHALNVCLETMIPSLYGMMILSELFVSSGLHNIPGKLLKVPARLLFKSSGQVFAIFLFSQIAGYPVGTKMLVSISEKENLSRKQISLFAGACFGGGPAFIASLFANKKDDAEAVFLACLISNLIIFTFTSRLIKAISDDEKIDISISSKPFSEAVTDAAVQSGMAILKICAMIIMFGGLLGLVELIPIHNKSYADVILGMMEISRVKELFPYSREMLPYIGALFSFGGICVLMQISVIAGDKINMKYIFILRIAAAVLTWLILFLRETFIIEKPAEEAAAVIIQGELNTAKISPIPSILLLIMTFMLLRNAERR